MMSPRIFFWKSFYAIANPSRRLCRYLFRPKTRGVKCLVQHNNKFLLVRIAYGHKQWSIPGGAVKRKESFVEAAHRELYEETGISPSKLEFFGEFTFQHEYNLDTVQCFYANIDSSEYTIDRLEIKEAAWFSREELPGPRRGTVDTVLELYDKRLKV